MHIFIALVGLLPLIPLCAYLVGVGRPDRTPVTRRLTLGLSTVNILMGLLLLGLGLVWFFAPEVAVAAGMAQTTVADPYRSLAAALAVGVGSLAAGYAVSATGAAAIGAIAERPETFGRALIFVGLAEGVAIYGLIIAFMILNR
ncbi:MAG TPA: ATP synthase subunit C [Anaerolineae bacterium]|nr:ATP synthase subunit C [Anaerolineae bacterium]